MNQKTKDRLSEIAEELSGIRDEEEEKLSNMSDKFSETQRYQDMEEVVSDLDNIISELEDISSK